MCTIDISVPIYPSLVQTLRCYALNVCHELFLVRDHDITPDAEDAYAN